MGYEVVVELREPQDRQLIADCAQWYSPAEDGSPEELFVSPLGRFGYTNSRLYRVYFHDHRRPPYVIKTDEPEVMRAEGIATKAVRDIPGAERAHPYPSEGECKAILYPLVSRGDEITELSELLYQSPEGRSEGRNPVSVLTTLYTELERAHSTTPQRKVFGEEYERYLHEKSERAPFDALAEYFDGADSSAEIDGTNVRNPARILPRVKEHASDVPCSLVHGDLHPRNVLLDSDDRPHLIDFAWGRRGAHWLKDFVLMETSIRFVEPPHGLLNQALLRRADAALDAQEDGFEAVRELAEEARPGTATRRVLLEMAETIEVVRRYARSRAEAYDHRDYLLATYLILMGGLRLRAYQHPRVLLSTCRLADALEEQLD